MEEADGRVVGLAGPVSAEAVPVLKPEVVEEVLARLGRGEPVQRLAAEYGIDRKTVRAWRAPGQYVPRAPRRWTVERCDLEGAAAISPRTLHCATEGRAAWKRLPA